MQAFLFLTALAAASAVDCRKRTIPDFLCLLTAAAGLISFSPAQLFGVLAALPLLIAALIQPECMGGGDIKFCGVLGLIYGPSGMSIVFLVSAVCAMPIILMIRRIYRDRRPLSIPFLPFLACGCSAATLAELFLH